MQQQQQHQEVEKPPFYRLIHVRALSQENPAKLYFSYLHRLFALIFHYRKFHSK